MLYSYQDQKGNKFKEWPEGSPIPYFECNECTYKGHGFIMMDEIDVLDPVRELAMCPECEHKNIYM